MRSIVLLIASAACVLACDASPEPGGPAMSGVVAGMTPAAQPTGGTAGPAPNVNGGTGGSGGSTMVQPPAGGTAAGAGGAGAGGTSGGRGAAGSAGSTPAAGAGGTPIDAGAVDSGGGSGADPISFAAELDELFMHDACTGEYPPQPDTCLHELRHEQQVTFGGDAGEVYDVTLRVRGLFEPTTISGGQTPMPQHPYFKVGGNVTSQDYSHWHIEVSEPHQTYWLNHYPSTSHTIYAEDFEATLPIAAGAEVVVRVIDGNDREIDNAEPGLADRRQLIDGVTDEVLDGQVLRLDVVAVEAR